MNQYPHKMKVLRLFNSPGSTSAPYNQFSLGLMSQTEQTLCTLFPPSEAVDRSFKYSHAAGSLLGMVKILRKLVIKNDYDVIHIHSGHTGIALILSLMPNNFHLLKKVVFTLHTSYNLLSLRNKLLVGLTMFFSSKICPCGKSSRDSIPKFICHIFEKKMCMIPNGFNYKNIDNLLINKNSKRLFSANYGVKLICVGALNDNKNQISLLKAIDNLEIIGELIFLGDGPKREFLEAYSKNLNSKISVKFKGKVSRDLAIEHMIEADVFISPSKGEGMPISVLEAMYSECFTILSDIPPHKEISPPKGTSIYVNFSKNKEIVSALNWIVKPGLNFSDKGIASKKYVLKNYNIALMLNKYIDIYNAILSTDYKSLNKNKD